MKYGRNMHPPRWVEKVLGLLLSSEMLESAVGDLHEKYYKQIKDGKIWSAKTCYMLEGIWLVRLLFLKRKYDSSPLNPFDMIKNYFLIAFRTLQREKIYAIISLVGLAIGMGCFFLVFTYSNFEMSYDRFHLNGERIYRITEEFDDDAQRVKSAMSHAPLGDILSNQISGVESVVRIYPVSAFVSSTRETKYRESTFCFADSMFFEMFTYEAIEGSLRNALDKPYSVVLTETTAIKYFGSTQVIGKEIHFEDESDSYPYTITSVIKDPPPNSHMAFNFIASFSSLSTYMPWYNNWYHPAMFVYLRTTKDAVPETLQKNILAAIAAHQPNEVKEEKRIYQLQPLYNIHLYSNLEFEWQPNSDIRYVGAFSVIGVFILLIAVINFINLTTARATKRAKEIGLRKVFGGVRGQLIWQFLTETLLYVALAGVVSLFFTEFTLRNVLSGIINQEVSILKLVNWNFILWFISFISGISLLAGVYPAFILSSYRPIKATKGIVISAGRIDFRKLLVTFQFSVSCLMITLTVIVSSQVNHLKTKKLGFDKEFVVTINLTDRFAQKNYASLKEELLKHTGVASVALSSSIPGQVAFHGFDIVPEGHTDRSVNIKTLGVDEDFLTTYKIELLAGRDFSKDILSDQTEGFIINSAAATKLGWRDPIGREIQMTVYINGPKQRKGRVIGLVENFHFESLHNRVEPLLIYINKHPYFADYLSVRLQPGNLEASASLLKNTWDAFHPDKPLEYNFLNDELSQLYQYESRIQKIFVLLASIAIFIAALGLFALSAFVATKQMKEMTIRKIFGATMSQILVRQYRTYASIFVMANLIVLPLSWILANNWLNGYANRIAISPFLFGIPVCGSLLLLVFAISYQSFRIAVKNPIDVIRHE